MAHIPAAVKHAVPLLWGREPKANQCSPQTLSSDEMQVNSEGEKSPQNINMESENM